MTARIRSMLSFASLALPFHSESGKSLGLRGGSEIWLMEPAVEDSGADLEQAVCADR